MKKLSPLLLLAIIAAVAYAMMSRDDSTVT